MKTVAFWAILAFVGGQTAHAQSQANDAWFEQLKTPPTLAAAWQEHALSALALSPDGTRLASGSWRREAASVAEIKIGRRGAEGGWEAETTWRSRWATPWFGKGPRPAFWGHYGRVSSLAWSPNGQWLASGGSNGGLTLWNLKGTALPLRDEGAPDWNKNLNSPLIALSWRQGEAGLLLLTLDSNGVLRRWKIDAGGQGAALAPLPLAPTGVGARNWVTVAAFAPDGSQLALGDATGVVALYDSGVGNRRLSFNNSTYQESGRTGVLVSALAFSLDGRFLASAHHGHVYLNSVESVAPVLPLRYNNCLLAGSQSNGRVGALSALPDGTWIARTSDQVFWLNPQNLQVANAPSAAALQGRAGAPFAPMPRLASAAQTGACVEAVSAPGSSLDGAGGLRSLF